MNCKLFADKSSQQIKNYIFSLSDANNFPTKIFNNIYSSIDIFILRPKQESSIIVMIPQIEYV